MTKKKSKKEVRQGESEATATSEPQREVRSVYTKPPPRPYPKRHRVTVRFPEQGLTRSSFKDECDIDKIVGKFVDTGMLTHMQRGSPIYGEAPDQTLFEAAITQAELRSAGEDGTFEEYEKSQEAALAAAGEENEPVTGSTPESGEKALHAENEAAQLASSAE